MLSLKELEEVLARFKEERNPNFNDEGVKRAVRAWEDYAARDKRVDMEAAVERDIKEMLKSDDENGLNWADFQNEEVSDVEVCKCCPSLAGAKIHTNSYRKCIKSKSIYQSHFETG